MKVHSRMAMAGALALSLRVASPAHAGPWVLEPKEYYSQVTSGLFETQDSFDDDRKRAALLSNGHYSERSMTSYNEFGWRRNLNLIVAVPFKNAHFREDALGIDETQTGFQDAVIGLKLGLARGQNPVALQLDVKLPLGYDRNLVPALGDGQEDLAAQIQVGASMPGLRGFAQAAGGYRYRVPVEGFGAERDSLDDPADEILYTLDAGFWMMPRLLVAASMNGVNHSGEGAIDEFINLGPTVIYRVDDALDLVVGSSHTMTGRNTLHTNRFFVGLAFKGTKLTRYQGFMGNAAER